MILAVNAGPSAASCSANRLDVWTSLFEAPARPCGIDVRPSEMVPSGAVA
jgi:hypothetical protein